MPAVANALSMCDMATLLDEIRRARGWSQRELAREVGYSQTWVSNVLRRDQALTVDQIRAISHRVGIPVHLLRIGGQGGDDPTRRREFGKTVALTLMPLPVLGCADVDGATAQTLTAITGGQRRLDATTPTRDLVRSVVAHVETANRILTHAKMSQFSTEIAAATSEAAGFAAWLHMDICDIGTARAYYRMAIDRARRTGHGLLAGYMLGSLAAFETDGGEPELGLMLISEARNQLGKTSPSSSQAWIAATESISHAARRDSSAAAESIRLAELAIDKTRAAPQWPWVFPFDHAKLAGYRALVAVRLNQSGDALAAFAESITTAQPAPKQRAPLTLEVATAARQEGVRRKDPNQIDEAFRLASDALKLGISFGSDRVIQRAPFNP